MTNLSNEFLQSVLLAIVVLIIIFVTKKAIHKFSFVRSMEVNRRKVIFYLSYLVIYILSAFFLAAIWGFDLKQLIVILSSIFAVLGVGFFAQWSILSNITASVILFFSHPLRIGDRIKIIDKDYDFTGTVTDISSFYLFMITDEGKRITLPTTVVMQKGIELLDNI